jgi:hypothetical protein
MGTARFRGKHDEAAWARLLLEWFSVGVAIEEQPRFAETAAVSVTVVGWRAPGFVAGTPRFRTARRGSRFLGGPNPSPIAS